MKIENFNPENFSCARDTFQEIERESFEFLLSLDFEFFDMVSKHFGQNLSEKDVLDFYFSFERRVGPWDCVQARDKIMRVTGCSYEQLIKIEDNFKK